MTTARLGEPPAVDFQPVSVDGLVRKYLRRVYGFCRALLSNPADAEDACQEVFLTVTRQRQNLASVREPLLWLLKIARLTCLYSRRKRSSTVPLAAEATTAEEPDDAVTVGPPLRREELQRVWSALELLPPRYQMILTLHYQQGLNHEQIAQVLEISRGAVRVLLFRAVGRLRDEVRRIDHASER